LRNLEQIQEAEGRSRGPRAGTLLLASLGAACVIFAVLSQSRRKAPAVGKAPDPLGELVAQAKGGKPTDHLDLAGKDVTFPSMLSDEARTTTALAAMRAVPAGASSAAAGEALPAVPGAGEAVKNPPPPTDRLPVVPLPAKNIVASSPVVSRPRDTLTQMAKEASSMTTAPVEEGHGGGYQLQTSSFRSETEAASFATALRQRGHRAYIEPAQLLGRGVWYRVRVGPFKTQKEAASYRSDFEKKEHLVPFIVEPPKEKPKT
jgi:cell division septation protein DedD